MMSITKMNETSLLILLLLTILLHMDLAQTNLVSIKSHKVLTKGINYNTVNLTYDNNPDTIGSFYSVTEQEVELEFDLGKNYLIEHVFMRMKREKKMHKLSLTVGNVVKGVGGLMYVCERPIESKELYECRPMCNGPGIIARKFVMKLLIPSQWVSVYEIQVFSGPSSLSSDDISSNRLVQPWACNSHSWLLTNRTVSSEKSVPTTVPTDVYFEKSYIITEVAVQFEKTPPKSLEIRMVSGSDKQDISLSLSNCQSEQSLFKCAIDEKTFSSRLVTFVTTGLTKTFVRGKVVFYPLLKITTSTNAKEKLRMTCEYSACDLSVHSDCSSDALKTGVKFDCVNKRLIRQPTASDGDSYVIVNQGKVEDLWQSTMFSVDRNTDDRMVVSMPRSYQYFGRYQCSCIVSDKLNTEISSNSTNLKESDFLQDLMFETLVQYKLSDNEDAIFHNASNKIIYLSKSSIDSSFLPVKITMNSLISGNNISVNYPVNDKERDVARTDRSTENVIKAFSNIPKSWSVATHKYVIDEIFPELINEQDIFLNISNKMHNIQQLEFIKLLEVDKVKIKPSMWSVNSNSKITQIHIVYANINEAILVQTEKVCAANIAKTLATFTNKTCESTDPRVVCSNVTNDTLISFKDERNFAKEITLDIRDKSTNASFKKFELKKNITLKQEDVVIKPRYTSVSSSIKSPDINVIKVNIEVISKKIADFIPCGTAIVKIQISNLDPKQMVLQTFNFSIDVEMTSNEIDVIITVSIDGVQGEHVAKIKVTDPTTFGVKNVEFEDGQVLRLLWHGVDEIASSLLESYELKIDTTIIACNTNTSVVKSIPKSQTSGAKNRYQIPIGTINQKHLTKLSVSVQPVFVNNKRGKISKVERKSGTIGSSTASIVGAILPTELTIAVVPSQSDLSCDIKDIKLDVKGLNVEKFEWKKVALGEMKYKITNLVPGRNYQFSVQAQYMYGPEDTTSKLDSFETVDAISIEQTKHVASINEYVKIKCTVDIGPNDKYRKSVEWLRADKSGLPDGVKSLIYPDNPKEAFLIMEKAIADYSGTYGCFARPSATNGGMKITVIINDLDVNPKETMVDFSKRGESVSVTCSTSVGDKNTLAWFDPLGALIPDTESDKYSVKKSSTEQNVFKSTLMIKNVALDSSGAYKCHKSASDTNAYKEFLMYGQQKLHIRPLPMSSPYVGEKVLLRCIAEPAFKTQKLEWQTVSVKDDPIVLMNTSYPIASDDKTLDLSMINSLAIPEVSCTLTPSFKESLKPISKVYSIKLLSKVDIKSPKEVNIGDDVKLICLGHPDKKNMKLEWIFFSKNDSSTSQVVKSSEGQASPKSYEPIKLVLNFKNVEENRAGRYDCKFKREAKAVGVLDSKSINLEIKAASKSLNQENPNKSVQITLANSVCTIIIVLVSLTINYRS